MGKLIFRYGTVQSKKLENAQATKKKYEEEGKRVGLFHMEFKPGMDMNKVPYVSSFVYYTDNVCEPLKFNELLRRKLYEGLDVFIIMDVQFIDAIDIDKLGDIANETDITIICYGLRTKFDGELFEESKHLMEIADEIEAIPSKCWCGKPAIYNGRITGKRLVSSGKKYLFGDNKYVPLCREHYYKGIPFGEKK